MPKIIYHHKIERLPDPWEHENFTFAVVDMSDQRLSVLGGLSDKYCLDFYVKNYDIFGNLYWVETNLDFQDSIEAYFYLNLDSDSVPDIIWDFLKIPKKYSGFLGGAQYLHANYLIHKIKGNEPVKFPNKTLNSCLLLKNTLLELKSNDDHCGNVDYYDNIISQLDYKIESFQ